MKRLTPEQKALEAELRDPWRGSGTLHPPIAAPKRPFTNEEMREIDEYEDNHIGLGSGSYQTPRRPGAE